MFRSALTVLVAIALSSATQADATTKQQTLPAPRSATKSVRTSPTRAIARAPRLVVLAVDQSDSTIDETSEGGESKATALAAAVDGNIEAMLRDSGAFNGKAKARNRQPGFMLKAIGYSDQHHPLFGGDHGPELLTPADLVKAAIWRDSMGNVVPKGPGAQRTWTTPRSDGSTATAEALQHLVPPIAKFVRENPKSPRPVVIHFTDGEYTTDDPVPVAERIMGHATDEGHVLMFNIHVGEHGSPFAFPDAASIEALPEQMREAATTLFKMSSPMPDAMLRKARLVFPEYRIKKGARLMVYNASGAMLADLLELGTDRTTN